MNTSACYEYPPAPLLQRMGGLVYYSPDFGQVTPRLRHGRHIGGLRFRAPSRLMSWDTATCPK